MLVWAYIETSIFAYEVQTNVKLFKDETAAREYFEQRKSDEICAINSWNRDIVKDGIYCKDGDIYLHTDTNDEFAYYEYGASGECECIMKIEEKEVN